MKGRPHAFGILGRPEPFFTTERPHKTNFLESLHRTYGGESSLPERDDAAFKKALEFRQKEKDKYKAIEQRSIEVSGEMERLRMESSSLREANNNLKTETDRIKVLWEQLSKQTPVDEQLRPTGTTDGRTRSARARSSKSVGEKSGVVQPANGDSNRRRRTTLPPAEESVAATTQGDGVRREVLPPELPDSRGQGSEHPTEGSEHGDGSGQGTKDDDVEDAVRADEA